MTFAQTLFLSFFFFFFSAELNRFNSGSLQHRQVYLEWTLLHVIGGHSEISYDRGCREFPFQNSIHVFIHCAGQDNPILLCYIIYAISSNIANISCAEVNVLCANTWHPKLWIYTDVTLPFENQSSLTYVSLHMQRPWVAQSLQYIVSEGTTRHTILHCFIALDLLDLISLYRLSID